MATNLNIVIGKGNVGAVGIRLRGAQGSGIEDVTVHASVISSFDTRLLLWKCRAAGLRRTGLTSMRNFDGMTVVMGWQE